jgi:hypothetical protein
MENRSKATITLNGNLPSRINNLHQTVRFHDKQIEDLLFALDATPNKDTRDLLTRDIIQKAKLLTEELQRQIDVLEGDNQ